MTNEEAISHIEYSIKAYQNLIENDIRSGEAIGKDIKGEWKSEKTLADVYMKMIESLKMAIKALEQQPCEDAVSRQDVLDLAKRGVLISNGSYESVCKAINELPPVTPQRQKGKWIPYTEVDFGEFKGTKKYECSECGHRVGVFRSPFCPNCGSYNGGGEDAE